MSMKCFKIIPGVLVALGILFGFFYITPACYAGGAAILTPEGNYAPEGSQIPEWRKKQIETQVEEYKQEMWEQEYREQQQEETQQDELFDPDVKPEGN